MDTKPVLIAESLAPWSEPARRVSAATEYARQMRRSLECHSRTFSYWKRLFDLELARARGQQRVRMALSGDWSGLGNHIEESLLIKRYSIVLDVAGLLSRLRWPGSSKLFETSVAIILQTGIHESKQAS